VPSPDPAALEARISRAKLLGHRPAGLSSAIHTTGSNRIVQGVLITLPDGRSQDSDLCALQYVGEIFAAHKLYGHASRMSAADLRALADRVEAFKQMTQDQSILGKIAVLKQAILLEVDRLSPVIIEEPNDNIDMDIGEEQIEPKEKPWPQSIRISAGVLTLVKHDDKIIYENNVKSNKAGHFHVTIHASLENLSDWPPQTDPFDGRYYVSKRSQVGAQIQGGIAVVKPPTRASESGVPILLQLTNEAYQALQS
jgi:hypothetical protein